MVEGERASRRPDAGLVSVAPLLDRRGRFADLLEAVRAEAIPAFRAAETMGRPLGVAGLPRSLAAATDRDLRSNAADPSRRR